MGSSVGVLEVHPFDAVAIPTPRRASMPAGAPPRALVRRWARRLLIGFVGFMVVGNGAILAVHLWAGAATDGAVPVGVEGIDNLRIVDDVLWRGAAPSEAGYRSLAAAGVTTVVDLRAETEVASQNLASVGLDLVRIPIRDGQTPTTGQVDQFLAAVRESPGRVLVHCGAGVGRTGAMTAAYLASTGQADGSERLFRNLAVGPPSLEQIAYAANVDAELGRPNAVLVGASRLLDAPRRIAHNLGF